MTIYIAKTVPFKHFFQGLCVLSFIRTSIATPLGYCHPEPVAEIHGTGKHRSVKPEHGPSERMGS